MDETQFYSYLRHLRHAVSSLGLLLGVSRPASLCLQQVRSGDESVLPMLLKEKPCPGHCVAAVGRSDVMRSDLESSAQSLGSKTHGLR